MRAENSREVLKADILAHYNKDMQAQDIANKHGVSKGVVIGMARRLGLQYAHGARRPRPIKRQQNSAEAILVPTPKPPSQAIVNLTQAKARLSKPAKPVPSISATMPPPPPRVLRPTSPHKECQWMGGRWDVDEPMCCKPTADGTSWCAEHKARVMVPIERRGRKPGVQQDEAA